MRASHAHAPDFCLTVRAHLNTQKYGRLFCSLHLRANGRNNSQQCWQLLANNVAFVCTFTRKISRYSFTSHQFWKTNKNFANKNELKQVTESIFSHYFLLENRFYTIKAFICRLQKQTSARSARIVVKLGFFATLTEND